MTTTRRVNLRIDFHNVALGGMEFVLAMTDEKETELLKILFPNTDISNCKLVSMKGLNESVYIKAVSKPIVVPKEELVRRN